MKNLDHPTSSSLLLLLLDSMLHAPLDGGRPSFLMIRWTDPTPLRWKEEEQSREDKRGGQINGRLNECFI